ncbi:MAG: isoprenylcysteine carboxylmethyltransferase family protein [Cytophagales bacterium]|nr:isoprenylcysteine carboxylmethyltransferase family protein [Cytophagales bacterium]
MNKYHIILILAWAIYFFFHSYLAGETAKNYFRQQFKSGYKYYRLLYNLLASGGLFFILVLNGAISSPFLLKVNQFTSVTGLILATWGFLVIKVAFKTYDLKQFLGTKFTTEDQHAGISKLITSGIRAHIRHPIYAGTILIVAGFWVFRPSLTHLISVFCIFIYLYIGIMLEEKRLIREFGDEYIEYRKNVPMLIPKIK